MARIYTILFYEKIVVLVPQLVVLSGGLVRLYLVGRCSYLVGRCLELPRDSLTRQRIITSQFPSFYSISWFMRISVGHECDVNGSAQFFGSRLIKGWLFASSPYARRNLSWKRLVVEKSLLRS